MRRGLRFIVIVIIITIIPLGSVKLFATLGKTDEQEAFVPNLEELGDEEMDQVDDEVKMYKYTTENLNLRTGPGTDEGIILTVPKGERVEVISHDNGWDKLIYNNTIGYSSEEYLSNVDIKDISENDDNVNKDKDELEVIVSPETMKMKIVKGILLVNKEYALSMDYNPGEDPEAREYLDKMIAACNDETGKNLTAFSRYRTYEYQKGLFNQYVKKDGYDNAVLYSAKPRHSEHETGLAFDIGGNDQTYWLEESFEDTEEGIWLRENAHRFGFILRYPKGKTDITGYIYEPWHFRYIGIEHASNIFERDITLEEYLLGE
ncbi:MAG: D-alanyl-D-alanine carboxypeptidase family protein [Tissierellaceae bacterium]|nr:D-alanyl-D-alanine carboxypeptidase family protein [Tissierellaceae bacterium]